MATTTTTTPAVRMISTTPQKTTLYASGGFMRPPRLLAAVPARPLQAAVVAVPATAAPRSSSGGRGAAMRLRVAASGASGDPADQVVRSSCGMHMLARATNGVRCYNIVETRGDDSLSHLSEMLRSSPAGLAAKYEHVEKTLAEAVDMARAQQDSDKLKFKIVLPIVRASYGMLELACALYPGPTADLVPQLQLPGEQDFIIVCLAPEDRRKDVMTPPMESLLNLTEPKKMEKIVSELPETDHRFVETIFFATGVAMNAAKALHDRAMTTYSSWDGKPR